MPECGFSPEETDAVSSAILGHRKRSDSAAALETVLYEADKRSRLCFACAAADECYWPPEKRNNSITL